MKPTIMFTVCMLMLNVLTCAKVIRILDEDAAENSLDKTLAGKPANEESSDGRQENRTGDQSTSLREECWNHCRDYFDDCKKFYDCHNPDSPAFHWSPECPERYRYCVTAAKTCVERCLS